jgi:hypothetical protein
MFVLFFGEEDAQVAKCVEEEHRTSTQRRPHRNARVASLMYIEHVLLGMYFTRGIFMSTMSLLSLHVQHFSQREEVKVRQAQEGNLGNS